MYIIYKSIYDVTCKHLGGFFCTVFHPVYFIHYQGHLNRHLQLTALERRAYRELLHYTTGVLPRAFQMMRYRIIHPDVEILIKMYVTIVLKIMFK